MKTKANFLTLISRFATILVVLCIVPSGSSASVSNPELAPVQNVTQENFTDFQTDLLTSISEQITELQNFYKYVSGASNTSELQEVLSCHIPENGYEPTIISKRLYGMRNEPYGIPEFDLYQVENVTDANFTDIQEEIVDSIGNSIEMLKVEQMNLIKTGEDEKAEELEERISELEYLSNNVGASSSAAELQEVTLTYMKTQAESSIEKEIEHIEDNLSDIENTTDGLTYEIMNLTDRISELTAQREKIDRAKSLADLKKIIPSSQEIIGIDVVCHPQNREWEGCNYSMWQPVRIQDNNTDKNAGKTTS